ncbi:hypothetical protein CDCA_CDCA19G4703 [Cyanidium caldarium]|uniref:PCI domain-containing protein n=1 Tax=Cyanidium caldarium TaxID=2771 RepID=A0AAV9J258_CYACA|nr:hypothetical protein CDCA_CDCA19G4703 [Cyanidium caldarium]
MATSRFFATGDTSSEDESSASLGSDDDRVAPAAASTAAAAATSTAPAATANASAAAAGGLGRARFLADESDSDDEDHRRVVKSKETKKYEALTAKLRAIKNHVKINDWTAVQQDFEELNKRLERALTADVISGKRPPVPRVYIAALVLLEDAVAKVQADRPRLSKTNTKALNTTRQRLRKNNREHEADIAAFRESGADPWGSEGGDEEPATTAAAAATARPASSASELDASTSASSSSSSSSWASSSTESDEQESETDEDESGSEAESSASSTAGRARGARAARWLKSGSASSESESEASSEEISAAATAARRKRQERRARVAARRGRGDEDDEDEAFTGKAVTAAAVRAARRERAEDLTAAQLEERLGEVVAARGRKGTDRREQVEQIQWLTRGANSPAQLVRVLLHLVAAQFDLALQLGLMSREMYHEALNTAERLLAMAREHPDCVRTSTRDVAAAATDALGADEVSSREPVLVDLAALVERLNDELYRAWQLTNPYSAEYVERLKDEPRWMRLAAQVQRHYQFTCRDLQQAARVAARRVMHLYYKSSEVTRRMHEYRHRQPHGDAVGDAGGSDEEDASPEERFEALTVLVYRYGEERVKAETTLAHVYHLAVEDRFHEARDLLLMSHLQDNIAHSDAPLQVLYNRALAQLGLAAFRAGMVTEAHQCLADLCSPPQFFDPRTGTTTSSVTRIKELLAQGLSPQQQRHAAAASGSNSLDAERRRLVPFHLQIPTDLLEVVHLTAAMLLEVPLMAAVSARCAGVVDGGLSVTGGGIEIPSTAASPLANLNGSLLVSAQQQARQVSVSRAFQHFMRGALRGQLQGPPENTRDYVMAASRHLLKGDWRTCYRVLTAAKAWGLMEPSGSSGAGDAVPPFLQHLQRLVKEAALKTFLFTYAFCHDSLLIAPQLTEQFELEAPRIQAIVSRMISTEQLPARLHQPSGAVIMLRTEPSRLQRAALTWAEKLNQLVENNERLLDCHGSAVAVGNTALPPSRSGVGGMVNDIASGAIAARRADATTS